MTIKKKTDTPEPVSTKSKAAEESLQTTTPASDKAAPKKRMVLKTIAARGRRAACFSDFASRDRRYDSSCTSESASTEASSAAITATSAATTSRFPSRKLKRQWLRRR